MTVITVPFCRSQAHRRARRFSVSENLAGSRSGSVARSMSVVYPHFMTSVASSLAVSTAADVPDVDSLLPNDISEE